MFDLQSKIKKLNLSGVIAIVLLSLFILIQFSVTAAQAGPEAMQAQEGSGTAEDQNNVTSPDIRINYHKRYPFAKAAGPDAMGGQDVLVKVEGSNNSQQDSGGGSGGGGSGGSGGGGSGSLQKSQECNSPQEVVAYKLLTHWCCNKIECIIPAGTPGYEPCCYRQPLCIAKDKPATMRDMELFQNQLTTFGLPLSDTQFQIIDRENNQRFLELLFDPERFMWLSTNTGMMQGAAASNSLAGGAETGFNNAVDEISISLINVANENAGNKVSKSMDKKELRDAIGMVQTMWHKIFFPMAFLFLFPGAVITQVKAMVSQGFGMRDETPHPFEGILRAIIAVFLIPATQLIVSYCIDVGNSMAETVKPWVSMETLQDWAHAQTYNTSPEKNVNAILPPQGGNSSSGQKSSGGSNRASKGGSGSKGNGGRGGGGGGGGPFNINLFSGGGFGSAANSFLNDMLNGLANSNSSQGGGGGEGKVAEVPETDTKLEQQLWLSQMMQLFFNAVNYVTCNALIVISAYQIVYMCYLFLLGPLSAAFFAWPRITDQTFRGVFGNWLNAVITLSLWRFYWNVILAVASCRVLWLMENGQYQRDAQFEMMVFTCFMGLLLYVPFQPFNFDPGAASGAVMQQGGQAMGGVSKSMGDMAKQAGIPDSVSSPITNAISDTAGKVSNMGEMMYNAGVASQSNIGGRPMTGSAGDGIGQSGGSGAGTGGKSGDAQDVPSSISTQTSSPLTPGNSAGNNVAGGQNAIPQSTNVSASQAMMSLSTQPQAMLPLLPQGQAQGQAIPTVTSGSSDSGNQALNNAAQSLGLGAAAMGGLQGGNAGSAQGQNVPGANQAMSIPSTTVGGSSANMPNQTGQQTPQGTQAGQIPQAPQQEPQAPQGQQAPQAPQAPQTTSIPSSEPPPSPPSGKQQPPPETKS